VPHGDTREWCFVPAPDARTVFIRKVPSSLIDRHPAGSIEPIGSTPLGVRSEREGEPVSRKRHHPPPPDDHELRRTVVLAAVQGLIREALLVVLREIWRGGPW
jgi:hypothetical protein